MMRKTVSFVFLAIASLMLVLPAFFTNNKPNYVSPMDNRELSNFPEISYKEKNEEAGIIENIKSFYSAADDFIKNINLYLEDRIGFRERVITVYQELSDFLFHDLAHPLFEYGKDGWIMTKGWDKIQTYHLDVDEEYVRLFDNYISEIRDISKENNAEMMFWLIPNKETVYPEKISARYNINETSITKSEKILAGIEKNNVPYLYLLPYFMDIKSDVQLYNKKYDAGHWNQNGAFYGIQRLEQYLQTEFSDAVPPIELNDFIVSEKTEPCLSESYFVINENTPVYSLKEQQYELSGSDYWEDIKLLAPENYYFHMKNDNEAVKDTPFVLIFGDSYLEDKEYFFGNQFKETVLLHTKNLPLFEYYVGLFKPDLVIVEAGERVVAPTSDFFPYVSLRFPLRGAVSNESVLEYLETLQSAG